MQFRFGRPEKLHGHATLYTIVTDSLQVAGNTVEEGSLMCYFTSFDPGYFAKKLELSEEQLETLIQANVHQRALERLSAQIPQLPLIGAVPAYCSFITPPDSEDQLIEDHPPGEDLIKVGDGYPYTAAQHALISSGAVYVLTSKEQRLRISETNGTSSTTILLERVDPTQLVPYLTRHILTPLETIPKRSSTRTQLARSLETYLTTHYGSTVHDIAREAASFLRKALPTEPIHAQIAHAYVGQIQAIVSEDYELAASFRDRIKALMK